MKILVVVDMQNDFINGALGTKEAENIVENVAIKICEYKDKEQTVIFTRDTHEDDYLSTREGKFLPVPHCIKGTEGWEIRQGLRKTEDMIVDKQTFGSLQLVEEIKKISTENLVESIEFVGLCTDICVISNVMICKAAFPEIDIIVDSKCCAGVTPESHKTALDAMKMCQIVIN